MNNLDMSRDYYKQQNKTISSINNSQIQYSKLGKDVPFSEMGGLDKSMCSSFQRSSRFGKLFYIIQ